MVVLLEHQIVAVQRSVELGEFLQGSHGSLDDESQHGDASAGLLVFLVQLFTQGFQRGDVSHIVIGDMRNHDPIAMQVGTRNLLDARQGLSFDWAKLGKSTLGQANTSRPPT